MSWLKAIFLVGGLGVEAFAKSLDITPCHYVWWFWTKYTDQSQKHFV